MDGVTEGSLGCLEDSLAECRVCVDRGGDVVVRRLECDGEAHLGDHFGGVSSDDVGSDDFAMRLIEEELHEAIGLADRLGLAASLEGEFSDLDLESLFLGGALGESDARNLGLAIGATGEGTLAGGGALSKHSLNSLNGLPTRNVCQPWGSDDISRCVDPGDAGLVAVVDGDVSAVVELDGGRTTGKERRNADRHEGDVCREGFIGSAGDGDLDTLFRGLGLLDLGAGEDADALLDERLLERHGDLGVFDGKNVGHHLNDGHLGAEGIEEVGELDTDRASTDDDDLLGLLGDGECVAAADDTGSVERKAWHLAGDDAGGDEDLRRREGLVLAISPAYLDRSCLGHAGVALDIIDLVLLEQEFDTAGELVGDLAGTTDDLLPVVLKARDLESEIGGVVADQGIEFGVLEQGLGWNAAPVQAGATGAFLLDDSNTLAELGGADRADISGGAAADDDEVVGCRGHK